MGKQRDNVVAKIDPKFIMISVVHLQKATWNYKDDDPDMLAKLVANIENNGQVENVIVRQLPKGKYEIVNGNHRYDAFLALGMKEVMCCDVGKISIAQAKRLAIETNETRFGNDELRLAQAIRDVLQVVPLEEFMRSSPYSEEQLKDYLTLSDFDFDKLQNMAESKKTGKGLTLHFEMEQEEMAQWVRLCSMRQDLKDPKNVLMYCVALGLVEAGKRQGNVDAG